MQSSINWKGGMAFEAESGSGHKVLIDGPPDSGGLNQGPRPMEMLLMGMGACSQVDVISILKKSRQDVSDCGVDIAAERSEEHPKVFTSIHLHYRITGKGIQEKTVQRAIELSAEKYCSASIMMGAMAKITHDFEILEG